MAIVETLEVRFQASLNGLSKQLDGLSKQLGGLGGALDGAGAALNASAAALSAGLGTALSSAQAESAAAGDGLMRSFSGAITASAPLAAAAARSTALSARFSDAGALSAAQSAGLRLSQGFAAGITSGSGAVMRAVNRVVSAAVARIRSALKIHSPSRVTFELGGNFGAGFAEGIDAALNRTEQSAALLASSAVGALDGAARPELEIGVSGMGDTVRAAVEAALGGTELVIPLQVDGMKLGEASIRGINRVTRSAGRLLLEI